MKRTVVPVLTVGALLLGGCLRKAHSVRLSNKQHPRLMCPPPFAAKPPE